MLTAAQLMKTSCPRGCAHKTPSEHFNGPGVPLTMMDWLNKASLPPPLVVSPAVSPASRIPGTRRPRLPPGVTV